MNVENLVIKIDIIDENGVSIGDMSLDIKTLFSMNVLHGFTISDMVGLVLGQREIKLNEEQKATILKFLNINYKRKNNN